MGAAERPRPDLYRRGPERLEDRRGRMVEPRTISGPPLVSMEKKIADGLKLKIGDEIVVNVLGRDISARISNLRNIDWQGLGINFVLVFSPNAFKGAPHSHVATLSEVHPDPAGDARIIKQVADAFPMVTSVRVREALETVGAVVTNLVLADPRRQRGDADLGDPGAGWRAGGRPPPPGLRRRHPEDARRDPGAPARRLRPRIPDDRPRHGGIRRDRGLDRGLADRDPADDARASSGRPAAPQAWSPPPWSSRLGSGSPARCWP